MQRKRIYNPSSNETLGDRKIFDGNPHGILNFTKAKYTWALKLWDLMEANTWFPKEVDTTKDALDYRCNLTVGEKRMYDLVWSQLISMDSFQTNNLADNINPYITAPEINAVLARQAYEEANHSKSYAVMVEAICDNTDLIYEMEKHDETLREKNDFISSIYEELAGDVDDNKLLLAMVANQILEGVYFYSGFTAIYALARAGKMLGSAQMIRFIQRDEITHLLLFQNMINSVRKERPD
ncbi:ribonucleotide-diphosphate reductase subunit beta, partial [Campylobacter coli]|nr:ribonucleotide-diphosphate reductase subunit beta [Campylobacter coli]